MSIRCIVIVGALFLAVSSLALADDEIFAIQELPAEGRIVSANLADFDGDGYTDLMVVSHDGVPPEETRRILVYPGAGSGAFSESPAHSVAVPRWSTVYDIADLKETPGDELVLLRPDGVTVLSIATSAAQRWDLPVSGPTTMGAADDERGFDQFRLVYQEFDDEPWILIPQQGLLSAITADGTIKAQVEVGRRANFFVAPRSGPFAVESDLQLFFDFPKTAVGDVNGDGQSDIVTATRHEIRIYYRNDDGSFPSQANRVLPLGFVGERDHVRGSGNVVSALGDLDGDGRLDLVVTHVEGSFSDSTTTVRIYGNRDGSWDLDEPDQAFVTDGAVGSTLLVDVEEDGRSELIRVQVRFSVFEMIELLLTQEVDTQILAHRLEDDGRFGKIPYVRKKVSTGISFETLRPKGFFAPTGVDINNDGQMDFITSADGDGIEIYLGGGRKPYARRSARQKFPSAGTILFSDINADRLPDFVLSDSQEENSIVRIGRNLGAL